MPLTRLIQPHKCVRVCDHLSSQSFWEGMELAAGEYKHTLSTMGEITDKGIKKSIEELNTTHDLFKDFIKRYRPQLDVERIATGEVWYGLSALELHLVDALKTSDDYLLQLAKETEGLNPIAHLVS